MSMEHVTPIVLAAGEGTRMKAKRRNKVAYLLGGRPIVSYIVETLRAAGINEIVVVVKFMEDSVRAALGATVRYVRQGEKKGTAAALESGLSGLDSATRDVLVMYGDDSAFYTPDLIRFVVREHRESDADVTLVSVLVDDPTGLGRIIRDERGTVQRIVEEKNATESEKTIKEINTGLYCFRRPFIERRIGNITMNPISGEYYLTDIIAFALAHGEKVHACLYPDTSIWFGVNTKSQWGKAQRLKRMNQQERGE